MGRDTNRNGAQPNERHDRTIDLVTELMIFKVMINGKIQGKVRTRDMIKE